jgi:hypothetical protein
MTRSYRILGNDLGCLKELLPKPTKPGRQEVDHYLKIYGLTETPNGTTLNAMDELRDGRGVKADTVGIMMDDLNKEEESADLSIPLP